MELIVTTIRGENQFIYVGTYIFLVGCICCLLTQTHTLNLSTMHGDTMSTFPVFQAFWIGVYIQSPSFLSPLSLCITRSRILHRDPSLHLLLLHQVSNVNAIVYFQQASSFSAVQWVLFPTALTR